MKKFVSLLIALCVAFGSMGFVDADMQRKTSGESVKEAFLKTKALIGDDVEMELVEQNENDDFSDVIPDLYKEVTISKKDDVYVEEYAGCYIKNNSLIICVTDNNIRYNSCLNRKNVFYKVVEHSLNELIAIQKSIGNSYEALYGKYNRDSKEYALLQSLQGSDSSVEDNVVYVYINKITPDKEETFRKTIGNSSVIVLVNSDGYDEKSS